MIDCIATILEYKGCPKWRVVKEGEQTFLHCPTTQTRIPVTLGELPEGASFEEGDADLPTGTELPCHGIRFEEAT
jgi:hypothetical protein